MSKGTELITIQKHNKLNRVFREDEIGPGGAHHEYHIVCADNEHYSFPTIMFQKGPRNDEKSIRGVLDTDLLEIVRDRLKSFQAGDFACEENAEALRHIEIALMYMNKRVEDRAERQVLGTNNK